MDGSTGHDGWRAELKKVMRDIEINYLMGIAWTKFSLLRMDGGVKRCINGRCIGWLASSRYEVLRIGHD